MSRIHNLAHAAMQQLSPENAHRLTLWGLKHGLGPQATPDDPRLAHTLFGKRIPNPIGFPGGVTKNGEGIQGLLEAGYGFGEIGSVMPRPREGRSKPRHWRGEDGRSQFNWYGLNSKGRAVAVNNLAAYRRRYGRAALVGANLALDPDKPDTEDLAESARQLAPLADYLSFNTDCPNTSHAWSVLERVGGDIRIIRAAAPRVPLLAKLTPSDDQASILRMMELCLTAGVVGFVLLNTFTPQQRQLLDGDYRPAEDDWPRRDGNPVGGYSGPGALRLMLEMVTTARRMGGPGITIIAVNGIQGANDIMLAFQAGADAVQAYTAPALRGPDWLPATKADLASMLHG
jgi:dihydroorotate dehydrogenase